MRESRPDLFRLVTDDDDRRARANGVRCTKHIVDQREGCRSMEDLRDSGLHARATARREHYHMASKHWG
jgi:hypothetical protein